MLKCYLHAALLQSKYVSESLWLYGALKVVLSDYKIPLLGNNLQNNSEMLL